MKLVSILLDRSGSMSAIKDAAIKGYNDYLKQIESEKDILISLHEFDSVAIDLVHGALLVEDSLRLNNENFLPRGTTPLYDAIGHVIGWTEVEAATLSKGIGSIVPVLMIILTDGYENASTEYDLEKVKDKIKQMEDTQGWTFMYLAASPEAWKAMDAVYAGTVSASNAMQSSGIHGMSTSYYAAGNSTADWSKNVGQQLKSGGKPRTVQIVTEEQKEQVQKDSQT